MGIEQKGPKSALSTPGYAWYPGTKDSVRAFELCFAFVFWYAPTVGQVKKLSKLALSHAYHSVSAVPVSIVAKLKIVVATLGGRPWGVVGNSRVVVLYCPKHFLNLFQPLHSTA